MHNGCLVFSQLFAFFPRHEFNACVRRYRGNHRVRDFPCSMQFRVMAFAQLTGRESLRDIETCLRAMGTKLFHAGLRTTISRSTLADANHHRDWRIYADFAQHLITDARALYLTEPFGLELEKTVYALDSTTIDLCIGLFPWAHFRTRKAAIKLHTLMDLRGNIPTVIRISHGKVHDNTLLDAIIFEPGAYYIMDRAYVDFARLHRITTAGAFFVTRSRRDLDFRRVASHPVDKATGIRCDQTIVLCGQHTRVRYPVRLRRIRYVDPTDGKRLTFLTNNFTLDALTIAQLYRLRWQIELFFKWIKQHLHIKAFYGTSENAVKTQIWIAISVYVLVAIIKKQLRIELSTYTMLQILSVTLFEKTPILQALSCERDTNPTQDSANQLELFDI